MPCLTLSVERLSRLEEQAPLRLAPREEPPARAAEREQRAGRARQRPARFCKDASLLYDTVNVLLSRFTQHPSLSKRLLARTCRLCSLKPAK